MASCAVSSKRFKCTTWRQRTSWHEADHNMVICQHWQLKGLVHPNMKIAPWFTHPQVILGVYDILILDEYNQSYIKKKCPGSSKLYNGSLCFEFIKVHPSMI